MKQNNKHENLQKLIIELKRAATKNDSAIWKRIASDLAKPTRNQRVVNIYKINQHTQENETIIVPGKVLGTGDLTHKVNVAAYKFSDEAHKKINANGSAMTIEELVKQNPQGKKIKIIG